MLAENHRKAAESIEKGVAKLQPDADPTMGRLAIEAAWGAAFHWIAFGCETRHHQHKNNHTRLAASCAIWAKKTLLVYGNVLMLADKAAGMVANQSLLRCKALWLSWNRFAHGQCHKENCDAL